MIDRSSRRLALQYPQLAKAAGQGNPTAAIQLFCLECMAGDVKDVEECVSTDCWLHSFRGPSKDTVRRSKRCEWRAKRYEETGK